MSILYDCMIIDIKENSTKGQVSGLTLSSESEVVGKIPARAFVCLFHRN